MTQTRHTFRTVPGYSLPVLSADDLARLHEYAERYHVTHLRFTPASHLAVAVEDDQSYEQFCTAVIPLMTPLPKNGTIIHSCNDHVRCSHEFENSSSIVTRLTDLDFGPKMPAKLKIGVAGCYRCCTMVRVRDIGIFPAARNSARWNLSFGGNGGRSPRIGDVIATGLLEDELIDTVFRAVQVYREHGKPRERTASFVTRIGVEPFLEQVGTLKKLPDLTQVNEVPR